MKRFVAFIIGISAIVALFAFIDLSEIETYYNKVEMESFIALGLLSFLILLLINIQWYVIANKMNANISFVKMCYIYLFGTFIECITPAAKAGGEASKVVLFKKLNDTSVAKACAIILVQKTLTTVVFSIFCFFSLLYVLFSYDLPFYQKSIYLLGMTAMFCFTTILVVSLCDLKIIIAISKNIPILKNKIDLIAEFVVSFNESFSLFKSSPKIVIFHLFLSVAIWMLFPITGLYIASVLSMEISFLNICSITYLTYMLAMLPLLPGSLGSFEASCIFLLGFFGVSSGSGIIFTMLYRFSTYWFVLAVSGLFVLIYSLLSIKFKKPSRCNTNSEREAKKNISSWVMAFTGIHK